MPVEVIRSDCSLIGLDAKLGVETGLSAAQWYACPLPRKQLKALMKRKDGPAAPVGVDLATDPVKVEGGRVFLKLG
jgi:hypothetical protein